MRSSKDIGEQIHGDERDVTILHVSMDEPVCMVGILDQRGFRGNR
jgi:hypothetical protein